MVESVEKVGRGDFLDILRRIEDYARACPQREAIRCGAKALTYEELWTYSDALGGWLHRYCGDRRDPIAVYGHKNPWMLVCFLACVKAGHGYCPIDVSVPEARVELILQALPDGPVLCTERLQADAGRHEIFGLEQLQELVREKRSRPVESAYTEVGESCQASAEEVYAELDADCRVQGDETWYIIFTSGSTGTPKGVQISADCLNHYLDWSVTLADSEAEKLGKVFLNQAPFSFDLSVMDLYTSLACGGTLYCLEKSVQSDYKQLMQALQDSSAAVWVSTPSFAEVCLSERAFDASMMPKLATFLFCGETLANRTVQKLQARFPDAKIVNTYGPTESTVAVTEVLVTPELAETVNPLPVGRPKPGTEIRICDEQGAGLPDGEKGEIVILGDTVSIGYYKQEELTKKAFFIESRKKVAGQLGEALRGYHTGDKGYLKDGMLFYCGRIDLQIKLHGYRIELEDIENNIRRLPGIEHAAVLANERDGKVKSLTACVVEKELPADPRSETKALKQGLLAFVPDYMVPKKFVFLEQMPMTANGKADRKRLRAYLEQGQEAVTQ